MTTSRSRSHPAISSRASWRSFDDQLEAVFERFYRVDPARSRAAGGSGIGLAIARALAQAMGGQTCADRPADGPGVTFFLELPAA